MRIYKIKDICHLEKGKQIDTSLLGDSNPYKYINGGIKESGYYTSYNTEGETVLVSEGGASCGYVNYLNEKFWCGCHCYKLTNFKFLPKYIYFALKGNQDNLMALRTGAAMPNIKKTTFQDMELKLNDDVSKQLEIVNELDKIQSAIDVKSIELTQLNDLVISRFIDMFGDPVENEKRWDTIPLDDACISIVDCPHSTPHYTYENTGYMCIRTSIVKKNQILWDKIEYIPENEYLQRIKRRKPQKGDVVYTREGAILGIAAVIDRDCNVALGQRSMLLSPDTSICLPEFLSAAMNFDSFLNKVLERVSGSASPHINVGDIRMYNIIMPPLELQQQFAGFLKLTDKSKHIIQKQIDNLQELFDSKMEEFFG